MDAPKSWTIERRNSFAISHRCAARSHTKYTIIIRMSVLTLTIWFILFTPTTAWIERIVKFSNFSIKNWIIFNSIWRATTKTGGSHALWMLWHLLVHSFFLFRSTLLRMNIVEPNIQFQQRSLCHICTNIGIEPADRINMVHLLHMNFHKCQLKRKRMAIGKSNKIFIKNNKIEKMEKRPTDSGHRWSA